MNITVTIALQPQVITLMQALLGNVSNPKSETKQTAAPVADAPATEKEEVKNVTSGEIKAKNGSANGSVTIEIIRAAVSAKSATKRNEIKALLAEFGADKVTSLQPDQYADFHQKLTAL